MSDLEHTAQEFKQAALARERATAAELLRAYQLSASRTTARVAELTQQIRAARFQGIEVSTGWLYERDRLVRLRAEIEFEINRFAHVALIRVAAERNAAVEHGRRDAASLVGEATGDAVSVRFGALNTTGAAAIADAAGVGSPLRQLFASRGAQVAQGVADELTSGVATGIPVRVIAARVRNVLGGELSRALTLCRTEVLRAYRTAALENYRASGIVTGYRWLATKDIRTCLVCIALDGQVFLLTRPFPAHINCRCTLTPIVEGQEPPTETAAEWFAKLSEGAQKDILKGGYEAYKAGKITLLDFVEFKTSDAWGTTAYQRPLKQILINIQE